MFNNQNGIKTSQVICINSGDCSMINERQCLDYAMAVANDEDGYEGIQFCRYIADIMGKDDTIDWNDFI